MIALISSKHNKSVVLWEKLSENKMKVGPCKYSIKVIHTLAHSSKSLLCTSFCISHYLFHCTSIMTNNECTILSFHDFTSWDLFRQFTNVWYLFLFIWAAWKLLKLCSLSLSLSQKFTSNELEKYYGSPIKYGSQYSYSYYSLPPAPGLRWALN